MKAFITGIRGFVGRHLAEHLLACGDSVIGSFLPGNGENDEIDCIPWDISLGCNDSIHQFVADFSPDAIFHLAAISDPSQCGGKEPSAKALAANVEGTESVLALARSLTKIPRFLFVSSCHVYSRRTASNDTVDEAAPLCPQSAYGQTKLAAEALILEEAKKGLPATIARAFHHTGPGQKAIAMLPEWCSQLARKRNPLSVKCLDAWLDLSDVRDIVQAYRKLLIQENADVIYNVGSGTARRSGDLLEQLLKASGDAPDIHEITPGIRHEPIANRSRLDAAISWEPEYPIEKTLTDTLHFWQAKTS